MREHFHDLQHGDDKDLIYEGIATDVLIRIVVVHWRRQRPDLRRDCDPPTAPRQTGTSNRDDKDLSGSCFAKDGSLERHSKRDELFLTANFSRRLELHYEGIATGGVC